MDSMNLKTETFGISNFRELLYHQLKKYLSGILKKLQPSTALSSTVSKKSSENAEIFRVLQAVADKITQKVWNGNESAEDILRMNGIRSRKPSGSSPYIKITGSTNGQDRWWCTQCHKILKTNELLEHHPLTISQNGFSSSITKYIFGERDRSSHVKRCENESQCQSYQRSQNLPESINLTSTSTSSGNETSHDLGPLCKVIRGDYSQIQFNGQPCTAMSASFIYFAATQRVSSFTSSIINEILDYGNEIYRICIRRLAEERRNEERYPMLSALEVQGDFFPIQFKNINKKMRISSYRITVNEDDSWDGLLRSQRSNSKLSTSGSVTDTRSQNPDSPEILRISIKKFIRSTKSYAILTTNGISVAAVKQEEYLYLFDSHPRDANGRVDFDLDMNSNTNSLEDVDERSVGKACIVAFHKKKQDCASRFTEHILRIVGRHNDSEIEDLTKVSPQDLARKYQYSIVPVSITFE